MLWPYLEGLNCGVVNGTDTSKISAAFSAMSPVSIGNTLEIKVFFEKYALYKYYGVSLNCIFKAVLSECLCLGTVQRL